MEYLFLIFKEKYNICSIVILDQQLDLNYKLSDQTVNIFESDHLYFFVLKPNKRNFNFDRIGLILD